MIFIEIQWINVNFYGSLNKAPAKIGILVMTYKECRILRVDQSSRARDNSAECVDRQLNTSFLSADFMKYWKFGQHSNITSVCLPLSRTQAHIGILTSIYDQNTRNKNSDNFIYKTDVQISGQGKTLFTYYNISNHG